jgi:NADH:ubiquinone oxidoreductase subunit 3 (subunit A)
MKCIPEILFIIVEFPIATLISWAVCCWYTCAGFFSFLFWLIFTPIAFIGGILIYMWVQSRRESAETRLKGDYVSWIIIKDENLA